MGLEIKTLPINIIINFCRIMVLMINGMRNQKKIFIVYDYISLTEMEKKELSDAEIYVKENMTTIASSFRLLDKLNYIKKNEMGFRPTEVYKEKGRRNRYLFQAEIIEMGLDLLREKTKELKKDGKLKDWIIEQILVIEARKKM